jgi:hypothetical protein
MLDAHEVREKCLNNITVFGWNYFLNQNKVN